MYVLYVGDASRSRCENVVLMVRWCVNEVIVGDTEGLE